MPTEKPFRSLRYRLLGPVFGAAFLAAVIIAIASFWLGTRWSQQELQARFLGIQKTLQDSRFPLNAKVLDSLGDLTQSELFTFSDAGNLLHSTVQDVSADDADRLAQMVHTKAVPDRHPTLQIDGAPYVALHFGTLRPATRPDGVFYVAVLFDQKQIDAWRTRAALLPLATGLSTIVALSSITLLFGSRLVGRIKRLQHRVETVAAGDFRTSVADETSDELGRLGSAVDTMARQLDRLWNQVNRQQGEKLLHQISGGLAHQLRNSLTGARMAVELHASDCNESQDEGLSVAVSQIEAAEDHVQQLLQVAKGQHTQDQPAGFLDCWNDVRSKLSSVAKHRRIDLQWKQEGIDEHDRVQDGPSWTAALTNLVHNAMQAGDQVLVEMNPMNGNRVRIRVVDNGPGVDSSVTEEIFEPFVTSKPEGMGLGLPVVRRATEHLGGNVHWIRENEQTVFEMTTPKMND